jgi:8-oxo-dGTP diphosphatase
VSEARSEQTSIEVRVVLITCWDTCLGIALQPGEAERYQLPGGASPHDQGLDAAARSVVHELIGTRDHYLEQLYTVSADDDGRSRVIVAYLALVWSDGPSPPKVQGEWFEVADLAPVGETDRMLIEYALIRLRAKIGYTTIAFHLLPPAFTLPELQTTYETILGTSLDKRNFRRRVLAAGFLEPTGGKRRIGSHRPAVVFRFRATHDQERYLTPAWAATSKEIP